MKHKESLLDNLFTEFQSRYNQAGEDEKKRLALHFYNWSAHQVEQFGIQPSNLSIEGFLQPPTITNKFANHPLVNKSLDASLQNIQSLVDNNILLRQITENIEQVIWIQGIHSDRIFYVSPAFERVWERPIKSLLDHPSTMIESIHPEDRVQVLVAKPRINHKPINLAYRIIRPDGGIRWISTKVFQIDDSTGKPCFHIYVAEDITDQKHVEITLRKTLDRAREQFDLSHKMSLLRKPDAVLRTLMSAHELQAAHRAALLFFDDVKVGHEQGVEIITSWQSSQSLPTWTTETSLYEEPAFLKLLQPNQTVIIANIQGDSRLTSVVRQLLTDGNIQTMVIFPMIASGKWLGCLLVFFPQEHGFEHIELRHLKILIDQTTITLFNLQLLEVEEESRHEAERANEIKTQFLAMITHELRTPLTSIMGFTTTLLADDVTWEPHEKHDFIQTINQETLRLQELIDHLLDLTRLEAGMLPISHEPHSIYEIIEDAESQIKVLTSGHSLHLNIPLQLPQINVDAKRIAQVLVNLIKNASSYAPKGTDINISANIRGDFMQINVNDQGPGIPPAEYKKVFKAFRRGSNAEKQYMQGAGLGLAICKGLIEAHGGRIWIKKKTLIGTTICFTVPLSKIKNPVTIAEKGH